MAPKRKEHSDDLRTLVIKHFLNGDSQREIAKKTLLSRETVRSMIKKYKSTKCIENLFGRGRKRKRKTAATTDRLIQRKLKCDRRKSTCSIAAELETELGILISQSTVQRRAHEIGLFGRVARKKPYVNKINRVKRPRYAKEMLEKPLGFWETVVWSDESKFNVFGSDGKVMVWRTPKEEFDPKCTIPTRDAPVRSDWVPVRLGIQSDWVPVRLGIQSDWVPVRLGTQSRLVPSPTGYPVPTG